MCFKWLISLLAITNCATSSQHRNESEEAFLSLFTPLSPRIQESSNSVKRNNHAISSVLNSIGSKVMQSIHSVIQGLSSKVDNSNYEGNTNQACES